MRPRMSAKFTPLASTRTRTSPALGSGSGASLTARTSGAPARVIQICRMALASRFGAQARIAQLCVASIHRHERPGAPLLLQSAHADLGALRRTHIAILRIDMDVRAAVAFAPGKPLEVADVKLDGPRAGEVLVEIKATGICHTDEFTLSGAAPEGLFPAILGHEGAGIVVDVGAGVTSVQKGDHVIPLYTRECRTCPSCLSRKTNLCTAIRATQGQGVMPDGTSRFSLDGKKVHHYMGC